MQAGLLAAGHEPASLATKIISGFVASHELSALQTNVPRT
jgi:hypothetical protein